MSAWKQLSWITGIVVFFSGIGPAQAASKDNYPILTPEIERSLASPRFSCPKMWVRIDLDQEEKMQMTLAEHPEIEKIGQRKSEDRENNKTYVTYQLQSLMWVPGSREFREAFATLKQIPSLDFVGCEIPGYIAKKK